MPLAEPRRWTFTVATPAGDVRSTYQLTPEALDFDSDALWEGGHVSLPWTGIDEAGTATLAMPVGRGAPDLGPLWYVDDDKRGGSWKQLAARHGGTIDVLELEDQTGRVSVWLKDADLLLTEDQWESEKDSLPPPGIAFMEELGFPWGGRLRVKETRLEIDAPVYVLGTLDERRTVSDGEEGVLAHAVTLIRTGQWRSSLIRTLPRWLGLLVAVFSGFLSIVLGVGRGGERVKGPQDSVAPDMPPHAVLVWKGRAGRPFIVSNRREAHALSQLRSRSLYQCLGGTGILCYCVYQLFQYF